MKGARYKPTGWKGESHRHYLAAKGVKTSLKKISSLTKTVRRPAGHRLMTTTEFSAGDRKISLITAPRRPLFQSFGKVTIDGEQVFEGSSLDAKDMVDTMGRDPNLVDELVDDLKEEALLKRDLEREHIDFIEDRAQKDMKQG